MSFKDGYLPLFAGAEVVRRSGNLTTFPPNLLLGNLANGEFPDTVWFDSFTPASETPATTHIANIGGGYEDAFNNHVVNSGLYDTAGAGQIPQVSPIPDLVGDPAFSYILAIDTRAGEPGTGAGAGTMRNSVRWGETDTGESIELTLLSNEVFLNGDSLGFITPQVGLQVYNHIISLDYNGDYSGTYFGIGFSGALSGGTLGNLRVKFTLGSSNGAITAVLLTKET